MYEHIPGGRSIQVDQRSIRIGLRSSWSVIEAASIERTSSMQPWSATAVCCASIMVTTGGLAGTFTLEGWAAYGVALRSTTLGGVIDAHCARSRARYWQ